MISVVMPAKNAEESIKKACLSVLENEKVSELIVVDDHSSDSTIKAVKSIEDDRIRLISNVGSGVSDGLNYGVEQARFEFIARCDSDDLYPPNRLSWQLEFMLNNPGYCAVSGAYTLANGGEFVLESKTRNSKACDITEELIAGIARTHLCTWLFKRSAFVQIGGVRKWFETAEDIDLQFRLAATGRVWFEPKNTYIYHLCEQSLTHTTDIVRKDFFDSVARSFALQRMQKGADDLDLGTPPNIPNHDGKRLSAKQHISYLYDALAWRQYDTDQFGAALKTLAKGLGASPLSRLLWRSIVVMAIKMLINRNHNRS